MGGGGTGGVDPGPPGTIQIQAQLASDLDADAPATVGIVSFSVIAAEVSRAFIDFGLDETYGTRVEVDLDEPDFRTLLLGMKPTRTYHFRVSVETSIGNFESEDQTLETGVVPWGVLSRFDALNAERREPAFILGSYWRGSLGTRIFVVDPDGEVVWFADVNQGGVARATMSMDGESIWVVSINNRGSPVKRVTWDTLTLDTYDLAIGSHDIVAVEDDLMAYIDYGDEDCESVVEIDPSGTLTKVFDLDTYLVRGDTLSCHGNALRYSRATNSYILSSLLEDVFIIPRDGGAVTRLSEIVPGGNQSWGGTQHGVHFLGDSLLIYANDEGDAVGGFQSGGPSTAIEYSLLDGAELWRHEAELYSANLGEVQRLPGGNTLITHSNPGIIREITPDGETVLEIQGLSTAFGYPTWRQSLYETPEEVFTVLR
jgi:hypothetical protein